MRSWRSRRRSSQPKQRTFSHDEHDFVLVAAAGNIMMDDRQPIEFEMGFLAISEGFSDRCI